MTYHLSNSLSISSLPHIQLDSITNYTWQDMGPKSITIIMYLRIQGIHCYTDVLDIGI